MGKKNSHRPKTQQQLRPAWQSLDSACAAAREQLLEKGVTGGRSVADQLKEIVQNNECTLETLLQPALNNPAMGSILEHMTTNTYDPEKAARFKRKDPEKYRIRADRRRALMKNSIISQIARLQSNKKYSLQTAVLSLMALRTGMHREMWAALRHMGGSFSRPASGFLRKQFIRNSLRALHSTRCIMYVGVSFC